MSKMMGSGSLYAHSLHSLTSMRSFHSISTVNSAHHLSRRPSTEARQAQALAAVEPSSMNTSGAPKPPSFKRSSPRKKSRLRSRRVADGDNGECEAAGTPASAALARALLPASVELDAVAPVGRALPRGFFEVDALDLAPRLLGKFLRRDEVVLRITEVVLLTKSRVFSYGQDSTL